MKTEITTNNLITKRLSSPVSLFKGCRGNTKTISVITVNDLLKLIQDEQQTTFINLSNQLKIAKTEDPKLYKEIKEKECPAFIPGRFPERKNDLCEEYVPLLGFDIDGMDRDKLSHYLDLCKECPYIFMATPSPSYAGMRLFVWSNSTLETHKVSYENICNSLSRFLQIPTDKELRNEWKAEGKSRTEMDSLLKQTMHFDSSTNNLARLWFYTYAPDDLMYLNLESGTFKSDEKKAAPAATDLVSKRPPKEVAGLDSITDDRIIKLCYDKVDRQNIAPGRNNYVFALASEMCRHGIQQGLALTKCLIHVEIDFDENEVKKSVDSAYKSKVFGEFSKKQIISYLKKLNNGSDSHRKEAITTTPSTKEKTPTVEDNPQSDRRFPIITCVNIQVDKEVELDEAVAPWNLSIENNCYTWTSRNSKGEETTSEISNFVIIPLYLLKDDKVPKRIWHLRNCFNEETTICVPVKSLANRNELASEIEGKGNFIPDWTTKQLAAIKRVLYRLEKVAKEIAVLGHQTDTKYYAFANGIFDGKSLFKVNDFGITETPKGTFYIPALSNINENSSEYNFERKFRYRDTKVDPFDWANTVCRVYKDNGRIGICFLIAALFRDVVFHYLDCFPILFLFGPPKTGKSTFRESLLSLFGIPQTAISLGSSSSSKGFARKLGQFTNSIICFEEYKNGIKSTLIEMLKSMYDGIGYERAMMSNDNKTHSSPITSACIVAGQEMPTKENALFSRVFILEFKDVTRYDKYDYDKLKEWENEGLGNVLLELLKFRSRVESHFKRGYEDVYNDIKEDHRSIGLSDRSIKNVAAILAPFRIIKEMIIFPISYSEVLEITLDRLVEQDKIMQRTSEVNQFWQSFEYLCSSKYLTAGIDYKKADLNGKDVIYLALKNIYPKYRKHGNEQNLQILDYETLIRYLKQQSYFITNKGEKRDQHLVRLSQSEQARRVYCFLFKPIKIEI